MVDLHSDHYIELQMLGPKHLYNCQSTFLAWSARLMGLEGEELVQNARGPEEGDMYGTGEVEQATT